MTGEISAIETAWSALDSAISAAKTEKGKASVSADGKDISVTTKWVTQAELDSFTDAIAAAETARDATTATKSSLQTASNDLSAAKGTYTAAMQDGIQEATSFRTTHAAILAKTVENVAIADKATVEAALAAYNTLSEAIQTQLAAEKALLNSLQSQIATMETTAANEYKSTHGTILGKTTATITIGDKTALIAAKEDYALLSEGSKVQLTAEKVLLDELATKITATEAAKSTLQNILFEASAEKSGVVVSIDGTDVPAINKWVSQADMNQFNTALTAAQAVHDLTTATEASLTEATSDLTSALNVFRAAMQDGAKSVYITPTPGQVTVAVQFNQTIMLTLSSGSFIEGIGAERITLGGDLSGLILNNVTKNSSNTITIQLSGALTRNTGIGLITIAAEGTTENKTMTVNVAVNPIPPPAAALNGLSIRRGIEGSGTELLSSFDPYSFAYSLEIEKETEAIKVVVTRAEGTTVKLMLDGVERADGVIALNEGENILKVIVSEANRSDRVYEITIQRGPIDECFIATAAFGSKLEPAVAMLRHFRDEYLLTNKPGTAFVKFYYRHSPPIAAWIAGNDDLRLFMRMALTPIIAVVYLLYHPAVAAMTGLILLLLMIFWFKRRRWRMLT